MDGENLLSRLVVRHGQLKLDLKSACPQRRRADSPLVDRLTPRELQVLGLVVQGYGNKGIGTELGLAEVTIKKHVQSIMGKPSASDRTNAAILGVQLGLAE